MDDPPPRLVVLGSSVTALAVARNAAALGMRPVIVDTGSDIATSTRLAQIEIWEGLAEKELCSRLAGVPERGRTWLIATSDAWLRFVVAYRDVLQRAFDEILHPGNEPLAICLEKERFTQWCIAHGRPVPRMWELQEVTTHPEALSFPLLLRPRSSVHGGGRTVPKALEVDTVEALRRALATYADAGVTPIVSESLLQRNLVQYSVGASRRGESMISFVAIKRRPLPQHCAVGTYVELAPQPEVDALARAVLEALDYQGIAEVEILRDEDSGRLYLIEINARPWVQYALGSASGHDLLGFQLHPERFDAGRAVQRGRRWLNFTGDLYYCFSRSAGVVRKGRMTWVPYLRSVLRANTFAYFAWTDPMPAWRVLRELWSARA